MRSLSLVAFVSLAALASLAGCESMNKPLGHPQSEPRTSCFSDVECPTTMKCMKSGQDVQGRCAPRSDGEGGSTSADGGTLPVLPGPMITPQPGDIQL